MLKMSDTIKARRRELGMTQEQLAQMLGVSGPAVSKWEQDASYPDVTLLPSLARALHTDVNSLMGFCRAPEKEEITQMLMCVNDRVKTQGIEAGIALAKEMVREYPDCGALLFGLAATLDGRMMMAGMNAQEREIYSEQIGVWYDRAAQSEDREASEAAAHLLSGRYLARGEMDKAQEMMKRLPKEPVSPRWPLEISLLLAQGNKQQARRMLENMLFRRAGDVQQILLRLMEMELEDGGAENAQKLADVTQEFVRLMCMHPYTGHAAQLMTALHRKDAQQSVAQLQAMFDALKTPWSPGDGLLYAHSGVKKSGHAGKDMLAGILKELRESEKYGFLRENAAFITLLEDHTQGEYRQSLHSSSQTHGSAP